MTEKIVLNKYLLSYFNVTIGLAYNVPGLRGPLEILGSCSCSDLEDLENAITKAYKDTKQRSTTQYKSQIDKAVKMVMHVMVSITIDDIRGNREPVTRKIKLYQFNEDPSIIKSLAEAVEPIYTFTVAQMNLSDPDKPMSPMTSMELATPDELLEPQEPFDPYDPMIEFE